MGEKTYSFTWTEREGERSKKIWSLDNSRNRRLIVVIAVAAADISILAWYFWRALNFYVRFHLWRSIAHHTFFFCLFIQFNLICEFAFIGTSCSQTIVVACLSHSKCCAALFFTDKIWLIRLVIVEQKMDNVEVYRLS